MSRKTGIIPRLFIRLIGIISIWAKLCFFVKTPVILSLVGI